MELPKDWLKDSYDRIKNLELQKDNIIEALQELQNKDNQDFASFWSFFFWKHYNCSLINSSSQSKQGIPYFLFLNQKPDQTTNNINSSLTTEPKEDLQNIFNFLKETNRTTFTEWIRYEIQRICSNTKQTFYQESEKNLKAFQWINLLLSRSSISTSHNSGPISKPPFFENLTDSDLQIHFSNKTITFSDEHLWNLITGNVVSYDWYDLYPELPWLFIFSAYFFHQRPNDNLQICLKNFSLKQPKYKLEEDPLFFYLTHPFIDFQDNKAELYQIIMKKRYGPFNAIILSKLLNQIPSEQVIDKFASSLNDQWLTAVYILSDLSQSLSEKNSIFFQNPQINKALFSSYEQLYIILNQFKNINQEIESLDSIDKLMNFLINSQNNLISNNNNNYNNNYNDNNNDNNYNFTKDICESLDSIQEVTFELKSILEELYPNNRLPSSEKENLNKLKALSIYIDQLRYAITTINIVPKNTKVIFSSLNNLFTQMEKLGSEVYNPVSLDEENKIKELKKWLNNFIQIFEPIHMKLEENPIKNSYVQLMQNILLILKFKEPQIQDVISIIDKIKNDRKFQDIFQDLTINLNNCLTEERKKDVLFSLSQFPHLLNFYQAQYDLLLLINFLSQTFKVKSYKNYPKIQTLFNQLLKIYMDSLITRHNLNENPFLAEYLDDAIGYMEEVSNTLIQFQELNLNININFQTIINDVNESLSSLNSIKNSPQCEKKNSLKKSNNNLKNNNNNNLKNNNNNSYNANSSSKIFMETQTVEKKLIGKKLSELISNNCKRKSVITQNEQYAIDYFVRNQVIIPQNFFEDVVENNEREEEYYKKLLYHYKANKSINTYYNGNKKQIKYLIYAIQNYFKTERVNTELIGEYLNLLCRYGGEPCSNIKNDYYGGIFRLIYWIYLEIYPNDEKLIQNEYEYQIKMIRTEINNKIDEHKQKENKKELFKQKSSNSQEYLEICQQIQIIEDELNQLNDKLQKISKQEIEDDFKIINLFYFSLIYNKKHHLITEDIDYPISIEEEEKLKDFCDPNNGQNLLILREILENKGEENLKKMLDEIAPKLKNWNKKWRNFTLRRMIDYQLLTSFKSLYHMENCKDPEIFKKWEILFSNDAVPMTEKCKYHYLIRGQQMSFINNKNGNFQNKEEYMENCNENLSLNLNLNQSEKIILKKKLPMSTMQKINHIPTILKIILLFVLTILIISLTQQNSIF